MRKRLGLIAGVAIAAGAFAAVALANRRGQERSRVVNAAPSPVVRAAASRAEGLLRQARVTGRASLVVQAEQMLEQALADRPNDYDGLRMLASVYLSEHRFQEAAALAERTRAARPFDPVNYGILGDAKLELGEYPEAFAAFDRMMALRPGASAYARIAYARELQGDLNGALESMTLAADATGPDDREGLAWARSQVGELLLQLGRTADARAAFTAAADAYPGHPFAAVGYAKVLAAEGNLWGAIDSLQDMARLAPTPDLAAQMGDLLERAGRSDLAASQYALAEAGWRFDAPEPRHLAKLLAARGRAGEAVVIAERAAAVRHDIFTEDALAWSYFKAGRLNDARTAMTLALRTGTKDREIRLHATAILGTPGTTGISASAQVAR